MPVPRIKSGDLRVSTLKPEGRLVFFSVMRGLDPRIYDEMDGRDTPGHDFER